MRLAETEFGDIVLNRLRFLIRFLRGIPFRYDENDGYGLTVLGYDLMKAEVRYVSSYYGVLDLFGRDGSVVSLERFLEIEKRFSNITRSEVNS